MQHNEVNTNLGECGEKEIVLKYEINHEGYFRTDEQQLATSCPRQSKPKLNLTSKQTQKGIDQREVLIDDSIIDHLDNTCYASDNDNDQNTTRELFMQDEYSNQELPLVCETKLSANIRYSKDPLLTSLQTQQCKESSRRNQKEKTTKKVIKGKHINFNNDNPLNYSDTESKESQSNSDKQPQFIYPPKVKTSEADEFLTKNFKLNCVICQSPLKTFTDLLKHFTRVHNQDGYVICCNKKFIKRSMLVDHVHCHLNPEYFKCNLCPKVMADRFCLTQHYKNNHSNKVNEEICDICGKAFNHPMKLKKHKLVHIPDEEKKYPCKECGKLFASNSLLSNHIAFVHTKKYAKICDICGIELCSKEVFERHQLKHKGITRPTVTCNICGLKMTDPYYLKRHIATQHPEDGKKEFPCHLCSKISPTLKSLKRHIVYKHETGYDFKCTICDKAFKRPHTLKEHMSSHTGTPLHACPHCPKTFNSSANMHHHRKKVHPKEWEETCRARYSGNLPPKYKAPGSVTLESEDLDIKHITSNSWLCMNCWTFVRDFHKFYLHIEDSHRSFVSLLKLEPDECDPSTSTIKALEENVNDTTKEESPEETSYDETNIAACLVTMKCENSNQEDPIDDELEEPTKRTRKRKDPLKSASPTKQAKQQKRKKEVPIVGESKETRKRGRPRKDASKSSLSPKKKEHEEKSEQQTRSKEQDKPNNSVEEQENIKQENADLKDSCPDETGVKEDNESDFEGFDGHSNNCNDNVVSEDEDNTENKESSPYIFPPRTKNNEADEFLKENLEIKCDLCQAPMKTFPDLLKHFTQEHNQPGYVICCKRKFSSRSLLADHVHVHLDPEYFKCNLCSKVMADRFCLTNHFKKHDRKVKSDICDTCGKAFSHSLALKKHKLIHIPDEEKKYPCQDCGKLFADKSKLTSHIRFVHTKKYAHICDVCGTKLSNKDALERHMFKHKDIPRPTITCNICGLKMLDPKYMKRHIATQHPEDGKKEFACHLCPKVSPTLKSLKRHIVFKHETGYDFKCSICDKAFKKPSTLKEHMAAHMGTALYTCPHCPKTFNSNANMHHHRKKAHPKEWEETLRARYSGNLPPNYKSPDIHITSEIDDNSLPYQFEYCI
ncbi:uncharacterized protein isoform X2 [Musca autumnalis]